MAIEEQKRKGLAGVDTRDERRTVEHVVILCCVARSGAGSIGKIHGFRHGRLGCYAIEAQLVRSSRYIRYALNCLGFGSL